MTGLFSTIRIPVQTQWLILKPLKAISRQKPSCLRVVVTALQVIQPRDFIIQVPRISIRILHRPCFFQQIPEGIVFIRCHDRSSGVGEGCHIPLVVGLVVVRLPALGHADRIVVGPVGIAVICNNMNNLLQ